MAVDHSTMDIIGTFYSLLVTASRAWRERYRGIINTSEKTMAVRGKRNETASHAHFLYTRASYEIPFSFPLQRPVMQASDRNILNCGYIYPSVFMRDKAFYLGKKKTAWPLLSRKKLPWDSSSMGFCVQHTVEPPLTPTSPQRPLFFVPADSPYIGSYLNLSTTATVTAARPQLPN